ncbi:TRAF family member-associated NF-kappa-B activator isoform X2 [Meriones unguiculatus]|uniref:TRAF family member-associated NF-kappa-B activator isoform X2 n=1 Tax=Meriones unguiculatus TaxID=10047 RepID=UPI000B4FB9F9|nr:TRAF family member-associated NF-kappa-B activator isoform X2 [Meriones unguiculatus]XP_060246234.1 TRAF family member-associated NF-kappa-B activator isoform X2 [Meriones unguiculatus]
MDKNIGEQLNRAYEAFRQACMDRDSAIRELQQKTENYELRIREQQEQLSFQQTLIDKLRSQLLLMESSRDNSYGYVPLFEDGEKRKNNLTLDEPHDKVKLGTLRDKQSKGRRQEVSSGRRTSKDLSVPLQHERDNIEKTFWDLKEEFHRICLLAKAQKEHLNKLNIPNIVTDTQCSVPVQCTDRTDKQEALFKPQAKDDTNRGTLCITSVTPRGLGRDEEDTSFESLSKFNVKFPPMDNDSTFLHSTPETPNILTPATPEAVCEDKFNMEVRDNPGNFVKTEETLFEIQRIDPITSAIQNLKTTDKTKPSNLRAPCLPAGDHNVFYVNTFPLQDPPDAPFPSLDSPGKAVRGPQQPFWKPFLNQDTDLSGSDSELLKPQVCEFCQELFPPSITSREDFLRHLNTHFNGET